MQGNEEIPGQDNFIPYPPDQGQGQEPLDPKALKEAQKQEKKEQQRLEKERKEQEKREAKERKEQEKRDKQQLNSSAKEQRSTRQKPTRREVTTSAGHGIRCVVHLLDDTDYDANFDVSCAIFITMILLKNRHTSLVLFLLSFFCLSSLKLYFDDYYYGNCTEVVYKYCNDFISWHATATYLQDELYFSTLF